MQRNQYCNILVESGLRTASELPHSPRQWFEQYQFFYNQQNEKGVSSLLRVIMNQTIKQCWKREEVFNTCRVNAFRTFAFTSTSLQQLFKAGNDPAKVSGCFHRGLLGLHPELLPSEGTAAVLSAMDAIDVAVSLSESKVRPRVLLATTISASGAGGGALCGAKTFEADLFRRSDISLFLSNEDYPLIPSAVLVAPQVAIMRSSSQEAYTYYSRIVHVDVAGVSSFDHCTALLEEKCDEISMLIRMEGFMKEYIRSILALGSMNRYSVVVLSFPYIGTKCDTKLLRCRFSVILAQELRLLQSRKRQINCVHQVVLASATQEMRQAMEEEMHQ